MVARAVLVDETPGAIGRPQAVPGEGSIIQENGKLPGSPFSPAEFELYEVQG